MRSDLNKLRPLYYSANDGQGGHAFILDGYDEDGKFHINWGWGGSYDGYFVVVDNYQEDDEYNPGHNMGYTLGMSAGRLIFPVTDAPGVCS